MDFDRTECLPHRCFLKRTDEKNDRQEKFDVRIYQKQIIPEDRNRENQ